MRWLILPLIAALLGGLAHIAWPERAVMQGRALDAAALTAALAGLAEGKANTATPVARGPLTFPVDHGPHPAAPGELWDLSALLRDEDNRRFGVRLTLVRLRLRAADDGVSPTAAVGDGAEIRSAAAGSGAGAGSQRRRSAFAAESLVAGQLVAEPEGAEQARIARSVSRTALGLAGAARDYSGEDRIWVEDWSLARRPSGDLNLRASSGNAGIGIELMLWPIKSPVALDPSILLGEREDAPAALQLYSEPRLGASGKLVLDGVEHEVTGTAWLDHGWGDPTDVVTSGRGQLAANRFELQLDDGSELACLHLRRRAGGGTPVPSCLLIEADGGTRLFRRRELNLAPEEGGQMTGTQAPLHWRLEVPQLNLSIQVSPLIARQADAGASYAGADSGASGGMSWSGTVTISGRRGDQAVAGAGHMDLNGYGGEAPGT